MTPIEQDRETLASRLLEHAAIHDAETSPYSPEQKQWADDLRAAAAALSALPAHAPDGWVMVPKEPTPEMLEAARHVKRERLLKAVEQTKAGKHPDTIGMALAVAEEWDAMLIAAPAAPTQGAQPKRGPNWNGPMLPQPPQG